MNVPVMSIPVLTTEVEMMARAIAGSGASADIYERAVRVAEAQVDPIRVRRVRAKVISEMLKDFAAVSAAKGEDPSLRLAGAAGQPQGPPIERATVRVAQLGRYRTL